MSAPAVRLGLFAQRYADATQWSGGLWPGGASAERACRPLRITVCFRNGASGSKIGGIVKPLPTLSGTQYPGDIPWGTKHATNRVFGVAAVCARSVPAGTIASSSGKASVTPAPRRKVRRGMCFFTISMASLFGCSTTGALLRDVSALDAVLERRTLDDAQHER